MLAFTIRLRLGTYDAGLVDDPPSPEWPPHPARLFCALVAGSPSAGEWTALRWLERLPPPEVHASRRLSEESVVQYVVTNRTEAAGGSQTHPGRKHTVRTKPRVMPAGTRFRMVWPAAQTPSDHHACLLALASRVPYLGRVTSDVDVSVTEEIELDDTFEVYEPVDLRDAEISLRVPYPGYSSRLAAAFDEGRHAWEESRRAGYRKRQSAPVAQIKPFQSPFASWMVFPFRRPSHLAATHVAQVTEQLRRAVIRLVEGQLGSVPPDISGHGADGKHHVAYLALPNVGAPAHLPGRPETFRQHNAFADGRLLGVALAVPATSEDAAATLHQSLVTSATPLDHLTLGTSGIAFLRAGIDGTDPSALAPRRWSRPASWWATATPLVLDRFPKPGRSDIAGLVADAIVTAGYPRPAEVGVSRAAALPGAPTLGRTAVQRRSGIPVRPWVHAWARFESPVAGPLIAGSMRYRGLGLFAPLAVQSADVA